MVSSFS